MSFGIENKTQVENQLQDLPNAVGGKITLAANTVYYFTSPINIGTNYIELADNVSLVGISPFISLITYTGTGGAIRGTDTNFYFYNLGFIAATVNAEGVVLTNNGKNKSGVINYCIFNGCDKIGTITGFFDLAINFNEFLSNVDGFDFIGNQHLYLEQNKIHESNTGTYINLPSGTFDVVMLNNNHIDVEATSTGLDIEADTITLNEGVNIIANVFNGTGTIYTGFDADDINFVVESNKGIDNFTAQGAMYWEDVTGTMSLSAADGDKKITGNTSVQGVLKRFTHTSPNRLTYQGADGASFNINATIAAYYTTGGAFIASLSVAKNGSVITGTGSGFTIYSADEPCATNGQVELNNGDYIELFIKKFVGGSTNIVVSFLNVQINEIT